MRSWLLAFCMPLFILTSNTNLSLKLNHDYLDLKLFNKSLTKRWDKLFFGNLSKYTPFSRCVYLFSCTDHCHRLVLRNILQFTLKTEQQTTLSFLAQNRFRMSIKVLLILGSELGCPQFLLLAAVSDFQAKRWFKVSHINSMH